MDELLKKLLDAEVLTEETRTELQTAIEKQLTEAVELAKANATAEVTAQLNEQWITERDILVETIDQKLTEILEAEITELKEDVERFRDLEAEYAEKLVESKQEMAIKLNEELDELTKRLDAVVEIRLAEELAELKDDINEARKNEFGRNVFEAFVTEFKQHYSEDGSIAAKLEESQKQLDEALSALARAEEERAATARKLKLDEVLAPLSGRHREVMEAILRSVDTNLLENAYATYIGRVLKESSNDETNSEKETKVLAEDQGSEIGTDGVVVNGDATQQLTESDKLETEVIVESKKSIDPETTRHLRKLAGIE